MQDGRLRDSDERVKGCKMATKEPAMRVVRDAKWRPVPRQTETTWREFLIGCRGGWCQLSVRNVGKIERKLALRSSRDVGLAIKFTLIK
jgi:hypothetical protein